MAFPTTIVLSLHKVSKNTRIAGEHLTSAIDRKALREE